MVSLSPDVDLALLEVETTDIPVAALKPAAQLGDEVWVVAFPRGRRATLVSGVISQLAQDGVVEGAAAMVDAPVSYGASGGGVFDPSTGHLVGIVEGYRTARVKVTGSPGANRGHSIPGRDDRGVGRGDPSLPEHGRRARTPAPVGPGRPVGLPGAPCYLTISTLVAMRSIG